MVSCSVDYVVKISKDDNLITECACVFNGMIRDDVQSEESWSNTSIASLVIETITQSS